MDAGVDAIQVRERNLEAAELFGLTSDCVALVRGTPTRIIVNDRLDVALAARAHGVHLRGDSMPPRVVRGLAPKGFLVGQSVHTVDEAARVGRAVDYLVAGTVKASESKPNVRVIGFDGLAAIIAAASVPVLAIGGIMAADAEAVARAGASGIAGIGVFMAPSRRAFCRAVALGDIVSSLRAPFGLT